MLGLVYGEPLYNVPMNLIGYFPGMKLLLIDLLFYGSSTLLRSFLAWSFNLPTLSLGRLPKRLTSTKCPYFASN